MMHLTRWMAGALAALVIGCGGDAGGESNDSSRDAGGDANAEADAGDAGQPDCDDAEDYEACVGYDAYGDEIDEAEDEFPDRNHDHDAPEDSELSGCDDREGVPHFCEVDPGEEDDACVWTYIYEENGKPVVVCQCDSGFDEDDWQYQRDRYCED